MRNTTGSVRFRRRTNTPHALHQHSETVSAYNKRTPTRHSPPNTGAYHSLPHSKRSTRPSHFQNRMRPSTKQRPSPHRLQLYVNNYTPKNPSLSSKSITKFENHVHKNCPQESPSALRTAYEVSVSPVRQTRALAEHLLPALQLATPYPPKPRTCEPKTRPARDNYGNEALLHTRERIPVTTNPSMH